MLRIGVVVVAGLFLVGCGGGIMPTTPPHNGSSGGNGSSSGSGSGSSTGSSGSGTSSSGSSGSGTSSSGSSGGSSSGSSGSGSSGSGKWQRVGQCDRSEHVHIFGLRLGDAWRIRTAGGQRKWQRGHLRSYERDRRI